MASCLSVCLPAWLPTYQSACLHGCLAICLNAVMAAYLWVWLLAWLTTYRSVCFFECLSINLTACKAAYLTDNLHSRMSTYQTIHIYICRVSSMHGYQPDCLWWLSICGLIARLPGCMTVFLLALLLDCLSAYLSGCLFLITAQLIENINWGLYIYIDMWEAIAL